MPYIRTMCRYHVQEKPNFCGATAAMMILAQQGKDIDKLDQMALYGVLASAIGSGIATLPAALVNVLNGEIPGAFRLVTENSASGVARHVIQSLLHKIPSAVTIYGDGHWAVVEGVSTDVDPTLGQPYKVSKVWMHNPSPGAVAGVPPHKPDDGCGSLGLPGIKEDGYDYRDWLSLVSLPEDANFKSKCVVSSQPTQIEQPMSPFPLPPAEHPFNKERAELALRENLDFETLSRLSPSGEVTAKSLGLVHSLAEGISDYYLVSVADDRGIIGLARIDANRPWLRSIGILGRPQEQIVPDGKKVLHALMNSEIPSIPGSLPEFDWWWKARLEESRLVWRPCQESLSPYLPFLAVPLGANLQPQRHAFVRFTIEPSVSLELTNPLQGG